MRSYERTEEEPVWYDEQWIDNQRIRTDRATCKLTPWHGPACLPACQFLAPLLFLLTSWWKFRNNFSLFFITFWSNIGTGTSYFFCIYGRWMKVLHAGKQGDVVVEIQSYTLQKSSGILWKISWCNIVCKCNWPNFTLEILDSCSQKTKCHRNSRILEAGDKETCGLIPFFGLYSVVGELEVEGGPW